MQIIWGSEIKWHDYSIQDRREYVKYLSDRWENYFRAIFNNHVDCPVIKDRQETHLDVLQGVSIGFRHGDCGKFDGWDMHQNDLGKVFVALAFVSRAANLQFLQSGSDKVGTFLFDLMELEVTKFIFNELILKHGTWNELRCYVESSEELNASYEEVKNLSYDALKHMLIEGVC